jgi:hypothetical protein
LSSVIGTVFAIIALATTITYITYSMNLLEKFNQTIFMKTTDAIDRGNEKFEVTKVSIVNNKFNVTVQNTGNIPVHITRLWAENRTTVGSIFKYDIDVAVSPGSTITDIGQNIQLTALTTKAYHIKLVTERGNTQEFSVNSANSQPLYLQLFALPETVSTGFTTTLLLAVTNNMSDNGVLTNLKPVITVSSINGGTATTTSPDPPAYPVLQKGDTAYFQKSFTVSGPDNGGARFTASLENPFPGNVVSKDVLVKTVQFAQESSTSLVSKGLTSATTSDDILIFHKEWETGALPVGARQMYSTSPDNVNGEIVQLDTFTINPLFFITANDTEQIIIPTGKWNATLRYISNAMPDSLADNIPGISAQGAIYHFEDESLLYPSQCSASCKAKDSTGDSNNDLSLGSGINKPEWQPAIGPNGSGAYRFIGSENDYMDDTVNGDYDIGNGDATTAGWFKTAGSGRQVIFRIGDDGDGDDFWEVALIEQNVQFKYKWNSGGSDESTCQTTSGTWNDNRWHHFVAIRDDTRTCKLYIDGQTSPGWNDSDNSGGGSTTVDVGGDKISIGRDPSNSGQYYFTGDLDDIIHWDNYELNTSAPDEVTDLFKTSYGNNAHKVTFTIDKVDAVGQPLIPPKNLATNSSYPLKFIDGFGAYSSPQQNSWDNYYNYTSPSITSVTIDSNSHQRVKIAMTFVPQSIGELNMKLHIDESDIVISKLYDSFLQIPKPNKPFAGYYKYDKSIGGTINVLNSGTNGAWLTIQSRVVFESMDETTAYAAWVTLESHPIETKLDTEFFAPGQSRLVGFEIPGTQPSYDDSPVNQIPAGRYKMYVFLNGYDQKGNIFLGTQYVGVVQVVE